jgi:hypothetical protein
VDHAHLRQLLRPHVVALSRHTHAELDRIADEFGLPPPVGGSKSERMKASFDAVPDAQLPALADRLIARGEIEGKARYAIEEHLWNAKPFLKIPKRHRRELARVLTVEDLYLDRVRFDALLTRLWIIEDHGYLSLLGGVDTA